MLELLSGKATVDQLARRFGVLPSTIEGWRADALEGISEALRRGTGKSARELELEREVRDLREVLTDTTIKLTLVQRAMGIDGARPTRPARQAAMSRETPAGEATVTQVCEAFGLSRAASYAARRPAQAVTARVVRLPRRPRHASAEAVLTAIRTVVDREPAWGCARCGRRCAARGSSWRAAGSGR